VEQHVCSGGSEVDACADGSFFIRIYGKRFVLPSQFCTNHLFLIHPQFLGPFTEKL